MNLFKNKNYERRIGPKIGQENLTNINHNNFKPRLYEEKINFDRMRMYRLNRVREQLIKNDVGACILFDPINIRYYLIFTLICGITVLTQWVYIWKKKV